MDRKDTWAAGDLYEPYVGRWSRLVAREFIGWLAPDPGRDWLDVGCGTGALTQSVIETAQPRSVLGVDPSEGFLDHAAAHTPGDIASFELGSAEALPVDDACVDVAVSGLVLNFVGDQPRAAAEIARAVRSGGTAGAYVWDYADKMELMRYFWDAAVALDPAAAELDEGPRFPICAPEPLRRLFEGAGLRDVDVRSIDVPTHFRDFDD
ncbi:MAG: class I SAM-dependent methyltransferase, partial [Candidatus Binatia bacterium]